LAPLEIAKSTTATDNEPDIRRFDILCVHAEKLKTMGATPFYKRICHVVISHDNLRSGCKTFSLHHQYLTRFFTALGAEGLDARSPHAGCTAQCLETIQKCSTRRREAKLAA
jgi:hypothetical protein